MRTVPGTDSGSRPVAARDWWPGAVVYQIYPRSFADASGDGVGDLRGTIDHLDHLQWLGVDAIWLSPFFRSPMADFGYDISDHCDVDPLFGTGQDAQDLIDEAHRRGLKVLFDIVLGHTSDQHPWFSESRRSRDSERRNWYVWRDGPTPGSAAGGPDPDLRDNVPGQPLRQQDWPNLHPRLRRVRRVLDEYPGRMMVGEVWLFEQRLLALSGRGRAPPGQQLRLRPRRLQRGRAGGDRGGVRRPGPRSGPGAWFLNNHDEPRTRSRLDGDGRGLARAELLAVLLLTLPGTVFLYQGEERGLADTPLPPELHTDRDGRDPQRTPMPWLAPPAAGAGAGFTTGRPWLPVGPDADRVNVADQQAEPGSTLHLYRQLIQTRRRTRPSGRTELRLAGRDVLVLRQETAAGVQVTVLNFGATPGVVPAEVVGGAGRLLLSTDRSRSRAGGAAGLEVGSLEGLVLHLDRSER